MWLGERLYEGLGARLQLGTHRTLSLILSVNHLLTAHPQFPPLRYIRIPRYLQKFFDLVYDYTKVANPDTLLIIYHVPTRCMCA